MKNNTQSILLISGAIIISGLLIGGAVLHSSKGLETTNNKLNGSLDQTGSGLNASDLVSDNDHMRGSPNALVTIVEFSDFECPYCGGFHPTLKRVLNEFPDQVRLIYKHFPLDSIHAQARPAALASECAGEQNMFWEFADGLFADQSLLGNTLYKNIAQDLGLNMDQFNSCFSSGKYADKVEADYQQGLSIGVKGTPGGLINNQVLGGALPYENLKSLVEGFLND